MKSQMVQCLKKYGPKKCPYCGRNVNKQKFDMFYTCLKCGKIRPENIKE